jgi:hypothetical protein
MKDTIQGNRAMVVVGGVTSGGENATIKLRLGWGWLEQGVQLLTVGRREQRVG